MEPLTAEELKKIQRTLKKRFRIGKRDDVIDIGFGVALKDEAVDASRRLSVCFYVAVKKEPAEVQDLIPPTLTVRVRQGRHYKILTFNTDVMELPSPVHTGVRVSFDSQVNVITTGLVVTWTAGSTRLWGVVTVGHAFRLAGISTPGTPVTIRGRPGFVDADASLLWVNADPRYDVALIGVTDARLVSSGLIISPSAIGRYPVRSLDQMAADVLPTTTAGGTLGVSLRDPEGTGVSFRVLQFIPEASPGFIIPGDRLVNLTMVRAGVNNAFERGTSGSPWVVAGTAAGLQIAAYPPIFRLGLAQAAATSLAVIESNLSIILSLPASTLANFTLITPF